MIRGFPLFFPGGFNGVSRGFCLSYGFVFLEMFHFFKPYDKAAVQKKMLATLRSRTLEASFFGVCWRPICPRIPKGL